MSDLIKFQLSLWENEKLQLPVLNLYFPQAGQFSSVRHSMIWNGKPPPDLHYHCGVFRPDGDSCNKYFSSARYQHDPE